MQRRNFIKNISVSSLIAASIPAVALKGISELKDEKLIKPPRLKKGNTLGLISPGGFISEKELNDSITNLDTLGFKVAYTERILARNGYLAGTDEQRAADVNEMFDRKDVAGIICARGGYGCARVLPFLNYELIKNNPKVLIGYSDVTALLYGIFKNTGLVCFHGPVGISTFNEFSINFFNDVLLNPLDTMMLYNAKPEKPEEAYQTKTIRSGKAAGKLIGGNLSIVVSMIGTPYDIDTENKIIFLEEVGEEPYRIDRMLTQMIQADKLDKAAGIVLGIFTKCEPKPDDSGIFNSFTLSEVLFDRLAGLNIPVIYGMSFGHVQNKFTLPFGVEAELNVNNQTLTLLEPACR